MNISLLSGETQPVQKIRISGIIADGICTSSFQTSFQNNHGIPIECSFTFPLPAGVCATRFIVKFGNKTITSRVSHNDEARLEYDDAIAQSDFAVLAQTDKNNQLRLDIGPLAPKDRCKISLFFDIALSPLPSGYLLVLPTSIAELSSNLRTGPSPPPIGLKMRVRDSLGIKAITTPFSQSKITVSDKEWRVLSDSISVFQPFHLLVALQSPLIGQCIYHSIANKTYLRVVATAPRTVRDHQSQFTILLENGPEVTSGQLSLIFRAIEFFILSLPFKCRLNISNYGFNDSSAFDIPMEMTLENKKNITAFLRQPNKEHSKAATFEEVQDRIIKPIDHSSMESIVIVIGSALPEDVSLIDGHRYVFLDPFSRGDLRVLAWVKHAIYIPVPDEQSIIASLLQVIKMTSTKAIEGPELRVGEKVIHLPSMVPWSTFSALVAIDKIDVATATLSFGNTFIPLNLIEASVPALHQIWAFEKIKTASPDEAKELAIAAQILTPDVAAVAVIERNDDLQGDIGHIETKMSKFGCCWVASSKEEEKKEEIPQPPIPTPLPGPIPNPGPLPFPMPMPVPISAILQPVDDLSETSFAGPSGSSTAKSMAAPPPPLQSAAPHKRSFMDSVRRRIFTQRTTFEDDQMIVDSAMAPAEQEPKQKAAEQPNLKIFVGDLPAAPSAPVPPTGKINLLEKIKSRPPPPVQQFPNGKKPFFLLRVLQLQNPDGSWSEEKSLAVCCGFAIPAESQGLDRVQFITAFVIACMEIKAASEKEKWELVIEKALTFLVQQKPDFNWEELISSIKASLAQSKD